MRDTKPSNEICLRKANSITPPLVGLSAAAACFVGVAYAQDADTSGLIVLPTVDVETTQVQAPTPARPPSTSRADIAAAQRAEAARLEAARRPP